MNEAIDRVEKVLKDQAKADEAAQRLMKMKGVAERSQPRRSHMSAMAMVTRVAVTSQPIWAWFPESIPVVVNRSWVALPSGVIATFGEC